MDVRSRLSWGVRRTELAEYSRTVKGEGISVQHRSFIHSPRARLVSRTHPPLDMSRAMLGLESRSVDSSLKR